MLITAINSFAKISTEGYPILALLVLIDRTTCQLTEESFTASSGLHFLFSCYLSCVHFFFLKLTPKMRNLKLKV